MGATRTRASGPKTADEGVVPDDLGGGRSRDENSAVLGRTTGSDEPATEAGVDRSGGDEADATSDGGSEPPNNASPTSRTPALPSAATRG